MNEESDIPANNRLHFFSAAHIQEQETVVNDTFWNLCHEVVFANIPPFFTTFYA